MIAKVAVPVELAHLDRPFDYAVAPGQEVVPGCRVRVRFAGRLVDGFVLELVAESDQPGILPIEKVVSPEPVLTPGQARLVRRVADHYAGTFADVVRLAVPPRHSATEKADPSPWPLPQAQAQPVRGALAQVPGGQGFLDAIRAGRGPRATWQLASGHDGSPITGEPHPGSLVAGVAEAVSAALASERRALVLVPDQSAVEAMTAGLEQVFGAGTVAELTASLGPSARYRRYLAVVRGQARIVVGTRAAALAPMDDTGVVVLVDDGSDLYAEPRAPYPHTRQVAALRASDQQAALLLVAHGRSSTTQYWIEQGFMHLVSPERGQLRALAPATRIAGARPFDPVQPTRPGALPPEVFGMIRQGLTAGPVLVQATRSGMSQALACDRCRTPVACRTCHGPCLIDANGSLRCSWCGRIQPAFVCPVCQGRRLRSSVPGSTRLTEELGRAFPGTTVRESNGEHRVEQVDERPQIVVATSGAEPVARGGYAAVVLLDGARLLARADLYAAEEALRRWLNATALARPAGAGGTALLVAPPEDRTAQAWVRLDPGRLAERELVDRAEAHFPPVWKLVTIEGTARAVEQVVQDANLVPGPSDALPGLGQEDATEPPLAGRVEVLGPVPVLGHDAVVARVPGNQDAELHRVTIRMAARDGQAVVRAITSALGLRSARKNEPVRVQVDPARIG